MKIIRTITDSFRGLSKLLRIDQLTVEICVGLFMVAINLTSMANDNLLLDKACRVNLNISAESCDFLVERNLSTNFTKKSDVEVQKYVSILQASGKVILVILPSLMVLLWGSWSDRHLLRKPLMILPMVGEILRNFSLILCYLLRYTNSEVAFVAENVWSLVFGSWSIMIMGVYAHILDWTTKEELTTKLACTTLFLTMGIPLGSALSGILLREFGYLTVFSVSNVILIIGLVFCILRVHDKEPELKIAPTKTVHEVTLSAKIFSFFKLISDLFNLESLKSVFKVFYKKRTNNRRMLLIMGFSLVFFGLGPKFGQYSIRYLYSRHQLNFNEVDYSLFGTVTSISGTIGLVLVTILVKRFKVQDLVLCIYGACFGIASSIVFANTLSTSAFYIAGILCSGVDAFEVGLRAFLSKIIEPNEAAKANAIIGAMECSLFQLFGVIFNLIYSLTLDTFPGALYYLICGFYALSFGIVLIIYSVYKSEDIPVVDQENTPLMKK